MPESSGSIATLTRQELENLRNDLHRHMDDDREDFKAVREAIASLDNRVTAWIGQWTGGIQVVRFVVVPASIAAAVASVISLIRHW